MSRGCDGQAHGLCALLPQTGQTSMIVAQPDTQCFQVELVSTQLCLDICRKRGLGWDGRGQGWDGRWLGLSQNVLAKGVISKQRAGILWRPHGCFQLLYL